MIIGPAFEEESLHQKGSGRQSFGWSFVLVDLALAYIRLTFVNQYTTLWAGFKQFLVVIMRLCEQSLLS